MRKGKTVGRTRTAAALAAILTIAAVPSSHADVVTPPVNVPIQPGARLNSECTLNFVFRDVAKKGRRTYIGTSHACAQSLGQRVVALEVGDFGTVVYIDSGTINGRFALIQIDRDQLKNVSRVVRGFGAAPRGYTTSRTARFGDAVVSHGYPYSSAHDAQGVTRAGVLSGQTSESYYSSLQPNIQDRGSPVIRSDGMAVGMSDELSAFWGRWLPQAPPAAPFPTVEGLMRRLRSAGFNVTL